jgi:hypothetical protein
VVRHSLLRDMGGAVEDAGPAHRAGAIDEYRELAMLAHAWERGSLEVSEGAPDRVNDAGEGSLGAPASVLQPPL